ncbi:DUF5687 family protein [uncultured Bacteroides sp.]|uniref:DUF5687 family protein n=1 Tax=uncultured Bacteroides sp. TaxID=162156 RepID=UPI002AA76AB4|nr:DUF5687 family protein [uncultured Bacteroides sp.]
MLLKELRKHAKLAAKRHPMFEKNKFGKFYMYFMMLFWAGYLVFFGILFGTGFSEEFPTMEPYHIMNRGIFIVLILDFLLRFAFQKTPTQEIKRYLLLPVRKNKLFNYLLLKSGADGYNAFWLFMIVPFAFITTFRLFGITGVITYCLGFYLLMILNNYWYLICRTLINEKTYFVLIPITFYAVLGVAEFTLEHPISTFTMNLGESFIKHNPLGFIGILIVIFGLCWINRTIMIKNLYAELSKTEDTKVKHVSEYKFLERYGEVGEYFRLELKLLFRNKRSKSMFRMGCFLIIMLTAMLFTPSYEGPFGKSFVGIYNFAILGILMLTQVMSFEGNYLDGLMSRKESIYNLIRAKYYFYSFAVIIPFILMIPAMVMGKISVLMAVSYSFFTTGFIYFIILQLAVYNNKTTPLNESLIGRQSTGTGFQSLISIMAFGVPMLVNNLLRIAVGETISLWILLVIGLSLTFTSNLWIMNIYKRFMIRRYKNMEGFRDTK